MALPSYEELVGEEALPSYEELTTPTTTSKPATIRSEGQGPEPRETFLDKMKRLAQTPSPKWLQPYEEPVRKFATTPGLGFGPLPKIEEEGPAAAIWNPVAETVDVVTEPANVAAAGLGMLPGGQAPAAAYFAARMAPGVEPMVRQAVEAGKQTVGMEVEQPIPSFWEGVEAGGMPALMTVVPGMAHARARPTFEPTAPLSEAMLRQREAQLRAAVKEPIEEVAAEPTIPTGGEISAEGIGAKVETPSGREEVAPGTEGGVRVRDVAEDRLETVPPEEAVPSGGGAPEAEAQVAPPGAGAGTTAPEVSDAPRPLDVGGPRSTDIYRGINAAGEHLYITQEGQNYRLRNDRPTTHARGQGGELYRDYGGDLSPVSVPEATTAQGKPINEPSEAEAVAPPAVEPAPLPYTREAAEARKAFSTKHAVSDVAAEEIGLRPVEAVARRDFGKVWDEADAVSKTDPGRGQRLVEELAVGKRPSLKHPTGVEPSPRAITDTENALILREEIKARSEYEAAIEAVNKSPGDPLAEARLEKAREVAQTVKDASDVAGTATARGLNARKMMAADDFSLLKMETEFRSVVNGGRALEKPQLAEVKALHERIANAEAKVSGYEAKEAFEVALKEAKAATKTKGFKVQEFLDQQAQRARERIVARRGKLYADPIGVTQVAHLADEAIIGASHIVRGVTKFTDWSAAMIREFGENIKPFLQDLYKRAQAIASEGTKTSKLTPEERMQRALAGDVKRIKTRTEQIRGKLERGEFEKPVKKPPRMSPEKSTAMYQYAKAKEAYHHALIKAQRAARPMWRKAVGGVEEAVATARAVKTAYDLSAVLRQGGAQVMAHPIRARNAFARMIESLKSEEGMFKINEEIKSRPNAQNGRYAQYKLFLADPEVGASLGKMEEVYASRLAQYIPGVRMSERGYVTFLNVMRADSMDALINAFETPTRKLTLKEGRALANYVNIATGRGNLGKLGAAARTLSLGLFAPRYMLSRFQYLIGQPLWGGSMRTRMLIAREYGQTAMGVGLIIALGLAAGATMETDSKSTDFGKPKFGNTRIDPWFGLQQHMVYLSRLWTGKRKTAEGKIVAVRGPKAKYGEADITGRFLRSKAAPVPGTIMDLYYGKDYVGNEVTPLSAAVNLVSPLSMQDIFKVMVDQGVPVGIAMGLLSFFGMGVSTYAPRKKKFKAGPVKNPYPEGTGRVSP